MAFLLLMHSGYCKHQDYNNRQSPLSPAEVLSGGECCTTFVPPDSTCNLPCWSKSNTSPSGKSSIGSCNEKNIHQLHKCDSSLAIFNLICTFVRARMAHWWVHLPHTNVAWVWFLDLASDVGWVCCWFLSLLQEVFFHRYFCFPLSSKTNIWSGECPQLVLCVNWFWFHLLLTRLLLS